MPSFIKLNLGEKSPYFINTDKIRMILPNIVDGKIVSTLTLDNGDVMQFTQSPEEIVKLIEQSQKKLAFHLLNGKARYFYNRGLTYLIGLV